MSILFKTLYLRVLLSVLPLGIILTYFGIDGIIDLPSEIELTKHYGYIESYNIDLVYYKYLKSTRESYVIKIKGCDTTFLAKYFLYGDLLKRYLPKAKYVTIWTYPQNGWTEVVKMEVDGKLIIEYKDDNPVLFVVILVIGLIITIPSIYYIFRHPEDLFGPSKKSGLGRGSNASKSFG